MIIQGSGLAISGLASGLDSQAIVNKLMQVEGRPRVRLEWEQALWERRREGWRAIATVAEALEASSRRLTAPETWKDAASATSAIDAWVAAYNGVVDRLAADLSQSRVVRPANRAEYLAAPLGNDGRLNGMYGELRRLVGTAVPGGAFERMLDIGIAQSGQGAEASRLSSARLTVDQARLEQALAASPGDVRSLLADTGSAGRAPGIARQADRMAASWRAGGGIDAALDGAAVVIRDLQRRLDDVDDRLARKRAYYENMFARLESMLSKLNEQQAGLSQMLGSLARS